MSKYSVPKDFTAALELAKSNAKKDLKNLDECILFQAQRKRAELGKMYSMDFVVMAAHHRKNKVSALDILKWSYESEHFPIAAVLFWQQCGGKVTWDFAKAQELVLDKEFGVMLNHDDMYGVRFNPEGGEDKKPMVYFSRVKGDKIGWAEFDDLYLDEDDLMEEGLRMISAARAVKAAKERDNKDYFTSVTAHIKQTLYVEAMEEGVHHALAQEGWL